MPRLQDEVIAAGHGQALAAGQHMVFEVTRTGHPQRAIAGQQPSWLRRHPMLRISHQYLFHDKLLVIPWNVNESSAQIELMSNENRSRH
ncbi:MAG: hypothetical protein V4792_05710 [Pseudomonadota bacterium]